MIYLSVFIILPLMELMAFIEIGHRIGFFNAMFLIVLNAFVGGIIIRDQGLKAFFVMAGAPAHDEKDKAFDSICLTIAGILLIIPGFITDIVGFLLVVPSVRNVVRKRMEKPTATAPFRNSGQAHADVLEGEYMRMDDDGLE